MEATWDTGRKYANRDQIIQARTQPDGSILFLDAARGVDGLIAKPPIQIDSEQTLKTLVVCAYDRNAFRSSKGRWMQLLHEEKVA